MNTKLIKKTSLLIAILTLFLVGLGGYVRATGAGLACPDWPLCFGRVIPEMEGGVFQEVFHRFVAGIVSLLILFLAFKVKQVKESHQLLWKTIVVLLVLLVAQIILGGLTVIMLLNPFIVTAHLLLGTLVLQIMLLVAFDKPQAATDKKMGGKLFLISTLTLVQIVLGGFVGSSGASMACPDIPFCMGSVWPEGISGAQMVQLFHRGLGTLILLYALYLFITCPKGGAVKKAHLGGMVFFIFFQISLGFSNVHRGIPVPETVTHLVLAQLILFGYLMPAKKLYGIRFFNE